MTIYIKTKDCGCVIKAFAYRVQNKPNGKMYRLGGHDHLTICDICKKKESCNKDTLYDMWINDNVTNDFKYAGWVQYDDDIFEIQYV